ncbi:MAG: dGTPase [Woeseiaceae bacterium]|jgi:dGTPase
MEMTNRAEIMIQGLFDKYMLDNDALPDDFNEILKGKTEMLRARKIADYIAGMTDRFAIAEFKRLI